MLRPQRECSHIICALDVIGIWYFIITASNNGYSPTLARACRRQDTADAILSTVVSWESGQVSMVMGMLAMTEADTAPMTQMEQILSTKYDSATSEADNPVRIQLTGCSVILSSLFARYDPGGQQSFVASR